MPIKAMGEYILIEPEKVEAISSGSGIIVSVEDEGETKNIGKVVCVGASCLLEIHEDHRIYFNAQAGTEIEVDGVKWRAIRPQDVIALIIE